ncbi:hypothetical protein Tco_0624731 [Tanacetum coccineum]|uniref:Uncharacterized protein n=1 Tax=Tanacetum coccineum TaxID=301880 RepID=A0ABQ4WES4_9ASTR
MNWKNHVVKDLEAEIEDLNAQLEGNFKVATRSSVKTKVLAPGMYAIDVKPIPHPLKNNRSAHLTYINHLKESVETIKEIVIARICGRTGHPLVSGLRLFKTYDGESFKAQELCGKVLGSVRFGMITSELSCYRRLCIGDSEILQTSLKSILRNSSTNGVVEDEIAYTCGSSTYNADILKSTDVSVGRSCRYCFICALCYPTNDSEDLGKFQAKADIGISLVSPSKRAIESTTIEPPARPIACPCNYIHSPTDKDLEILFQPMFDEYFDQSTDSEPVPTATVVNAPIVSINTSVSTTIAQDAPSTSHSLSSSQVHPLVFPQGVAAGPTIEDTSITQADLHPSVNPVAGEPSSAQSTSGDVSLAEPNQVNQPPDHLRKWTKDHPLDNIVGNPSRRPYPPKNT